MSERLKFRDALTEKLQTAFKDRKDVRVQYENAPLVDMDTSTLPVLACEIVYRNAEQADMADVPRIRDDGEILCTVIVKEMTGNRLAIALRDEVAVLLQRQELGSARTFVGRVLPNSDLVKGWTGYRVAIPFWHYHF